MDEDVKKFFEGLSANAAAGGAAAQEPEVRLASVKADLAPARISARRVSEPSAGYPIAQDTEEDERQSILSEEEFGEGDGQLTVDVYQTPDDIVIQSAIAGATPDLLEVSISNEMVTIRGKREKSSSVDNGDYLVQELYWGRFSRSIILPQEIDSEKAAADLKNGVLTIRLPKIKKLKVKKLKIKF